MQCNTMKDNKMQTKEVQHKAIQGNAMQWNATQYNAIQNKNKTKKYKAEQCKAMQHNTMKYKAMQHNAMHAFMSTYCFVEMLNLLLLMVLLCLGFALRNIVTKKRTKKNQIANWLSSFELPALQLWTLNRRAFQSCNSLQLTHWSQAPPV